MKTLCIGQNDAGQRLDKFLQKALCNLPQGMLYRAIRLKRIKCNGKRTAADYRLQQGDILVIYLNDEFFPRPTQAAPDFANAPNILVIAYEDDNVLIADKPAGLLVHSDESGRSDTLIARIHRYLWEKGEYNPATEQSFAPALCNRIDRNTSGLVIAAKNAEALRLMNQYIKEDRLDKRYRCIALGPMSKQTDTLTGYLLKDERTNQVSLFPHPLPGAKLAKTAYRVLQEKGELSLLEVKLLTGRTHQIRAQLAAIGHPLLGDGKYGKNRINKQYGLTWQALCSYSVTFRLGEQKEDLLGYLDGVTIQAKQVPFAHLMMDHPSSI